MAKFLFDYYFQYNFQKYGFMIKKSFIFVYIWISFFLIFIQWFLLPKEKM